MMKLFIISLLISGLVSAEISVPEFVEKFHTQNAHFTLTKPGSSQQFTYAQVEKKNLIVRRTLHAPQSYDYCIDESDSSIMFDSSENDKALKILKPKSREKEAVFANPVQKLLDYSKFGHVKLRKLDSGEVVITCKVKAGSYKFPFTPDPLAKHEDYIHDALIFYYFSKDLKIDRIEYHIGAHSRVYESVQVGFEKSSLIREPAKIVSLKKSYSALVVRHLLLSVYDVK